MTDIASILAPIKEALPEPVQRRTYFCNKCGLLGESELKHTGCYYSAFPSGPYYSADQMRSYALAAVEALQAERDALRDSLATEISRSCASERDCIWQPHCAGAGECLRPERPFDAALSAQTTKEA